MRIAKRPEFNISVPVAKTTGAKLGLDTGKAARPDVPRRFDPVPHWWLRSDLDGLLPPLDASQAYTFLAWLHERPCWCPCVALVPSNTFKTHRVEV